MSRLFLAGIGLIFVSLLFKSSAFPFHWWTPDVYQGSSSPLTGFMSTAVKISIFLFFLKFISLEVLSHPNAKTFVTIFMWLSVFTMLIGNSAALFQFNVKRMLAYSGIAHSGYLLMGILAVGLSGSAMASASVLYYLLTYVFATMGLFSILSLIETKDRQHITFDTLRGLAYHHPYLALGFTFFALSLAGLPLTAGFFGKFSLFSGSLDVGLYWITIWAVLNSVLSFYYYLYPSVVMFMKYGDSISIRKSPSTQSMIIVSFLFTLALGILIEPFYNLIFQSVL